MRPSGKFTRARLLISAAAGALALSASAALAQEAQFNIAPQDLTSALYEFGSKSSRQVMFTPDVTASKRTAGVSGVGDEVAALEQLLKGTGLTYRVNGNVLIVMQQEGGSGPQGASAEDVSAVEELIVTAQKKEEAIQDVPIAISAFTQKSLDAQKIEGGFDLLKAIPNVSFTKTNFTGYNFSIRGIGTQAISATTDPGVAVSFNNTTLIVNRLFEQEYVDVERVEVLRGPQGTLYGRNATAGVINVISAKPRLGEFEGEVKLEGGNFNAQRVRGFVNVPIGETLALRGAFAMTKRDGYGVNQAASDPDVDANVSADVDGRDLWTGRLTVGWEPIEALRFNMMWEHFDEDDNRVRTSKQLCHRDTGAEIFDGNGDLVDARSYYNSNLSQGCKAGSLYEAEAYGAPNGASLPYVSALFHAPQQAAGGFGAFLGSTVHAWGLGGNPWHPSQWDTPGVAPADMPCALIAREQVMLPVDVCNPDVYGGQVQSRDLRSIYSLIEPTYRAKSDVFELSFDLNLTDSLTFTSQTVYAKDDYYASQDYNRFSSLPIWNDSTQACGITPSPFSRNLSLATVDCSDDPNTGRGTFAPLTDANGDGFIDQNGRPIGDYTVDGGGFVRDADGRRVGFYRDLTPGGVLCDPQLGCASSLVAQDLSKAKSSQYNQEFRIASNFDAPLNFSAGMNFTKFETTNDYYVFVNSLTYLLNYWPFQFHNSTCVTEGLLCRYVDPNPIESLDEEGHNYFRSSNPYRLTSSALFGELYWNVTEAVKVTAGARLTWDRKVFTPIASQLLLADYREIRMSGDNFGPAPGDPPENCRSDASFCGLMGTAVGGRGFVASPDIVQEWREPTGRLVVDWKPELGFTDETMIYASVSRGYKGGGANPPSVAPPAKAYFDRASGGLPEVFDAEYVTAFEIGTKNTLLDGGLILNLGGFYYDYTGYQVSEIADRRAVNRNYDAEIWGVEAEWIFSPTRNLRFNGTIGHLGTRIADGERAIDIMDRAAGGRRHFTSSHPESDWAEGFDDWIVVQPWLTAAANCVAPRELVEANVQALTPGSGVSGVFLSAFCPSGNLAGAPASPVPHFDENGDLVLDVDIGYIASRDAPNGGAGFFKELGGNELPNAPHWTGSFGGQYILALPGGWDATLRGDFYWQSQSYHRVFNSQYDKLRAWTNTNISLWVENPDWGVKAEVYVKNAFDETPITGAFLNSEDSGLTTNVFTLDPRLIGVSVVKTF